MIIKMRCHKNKNENENCESHKRKPQQNNEKLKGNKTLTVEL